MTTSPPHPDNSPFVLPPDGYKTAWVGEPTEEPELARETHLAGTIPARLIASSDGLSPVGMTFLHGNRDDDLEWQIADLTISVKHVGGVGMNPFTALALGAPLLSAHVIRLANALGIHTIPGHLDDRAVWSLLVEPLTSFFSEDEVRAVEIEVVCALELFDFVRNYQPRKDGATGMAPLEFWLLDHAELGRIVERPCASLTILTKDVEALTEFRTEMEKFLPWSDCTGES